MASSQPCYRVKIILVEEEYTHSLYSMDEASMASLSFLGLFFVVFFSSLGHLSCDKGRYDSYLQELPI